MWIINEKETFNQNWFLVEASPATKEKQDDILDSLSLLATKAKQLPDNHQVTISNPTANPETWLAKEETLQSIAGNFLVSSNIDMSDATYYYFLSFIPNSTKWRINRLNKTSYVSDYATGDSTIATAWTNRATQTYSIIY